jgi:quercetin dioxygenase-like cupin family protein
MFALIFFTVFSLRFPLLSNRKPLSSAVKTLLLNTTTSWDNVTYLFPQGQPQMSVLKIAIPPNSHLPVHFHPMPNIAYVQAGTLTVVRMSDCHSLRISAGNVLAEMVNTPHFGFAGNEAVELIVFYAGAVGLPLSTEENETIDKCAYVIGPPSPSPESGRSSLPTAAMVGIAIGTIVIVTLAISATVYFHYGWRRSTTVGEDQLLTEN